jgi:hypothetical protein
MCQSVVVRLDGSFWDDVLNDTADGKIKFVKRQLVVVTVR